LIGDETRDERPGQELILERLVQVLLAGLSDPALANTLREIHVDVARRWTVADLARRAFMSRAAFAERFARKVGMPPMEYVLEWRMAIAKDLLRNERPPLARVAERVGYQSASAFSTAFTRFAGCPPSEFARLAE
jgi:AraC-like DNA-binding protein